MPMVLRVSDQAVLARTKNFTILPASKEGLGIALDYGAVQSEAEEIDQQAEDGRDELLELPPSLPSRKSNKRKPARKIFQVDDFEIDPPTFPDQPSSAKRPRFDAPTSKPARKTGVKAHPAASNGRTGKGKAPARIRTQTTSLHQIDEEEDYDLYPGTRLCELGLPKSINKLLTECSIITLEDLRNAIKGDTSFFDAGTDIPVEDFLSFMQTKLSQYATGSIGFQYDFNRMHESGRAETDDGNDNQQEDTRDHKNAFINNCFTILKAGRVLTRALRAVEWE